MKHTPGPWSPEPDRHSGDMAVVDALSEDRRYVQREICHILLDDSDQESRDVDRANLILIAAAPPDMLSALVLAGVFIAEDTCRHDHEKAIVLAAVDAAISLATRSSK